ncbi:extracellular matrix regulator RemB [Paucisalibacillus globulus]|jgi:extracellular matrix regulatory protein B|uniref:extracellular matrix regulator RemB n=1 Tax=Paucisalibacillus globulus TaxID=351095 RepID=UPI0003F725C4|nr:extracellular matrix/biofilm biosynthesis regulator RemA family protein [Paucisalibacillus globulus]
MFIHIGNENVIRSKDIVSIIDYNIISSSTIMDEMMTANQAIIIGPVEDAKAVVITNNQLYLSTLSVATLKKRASIMSTISKLDDYSSDLELE